MDTKLREKKSQQAPDIDTLHSARVYIQRRFGNQELAESWPLSRIMHYMAAEVYLDILGDPKKQEKLAAKEWAKQIENTEFPLDMMELS